MRVFSSLLVVAGCSGLFGCSNLLGFDDVTLFEDGGLPPDADPNLPDARPPADALAQTCNPVSGTNISLVTVASGLSSPVFVTSPPGDPRLFIVERGGRIKIVEDGSVLPAPFLDLSATVRAGGEQGLLGLAFHPDYATNGRFFVNYTAANPSGDTVIAEYTVSGDPNVANTTEARLLIVPQDFSNHNGGMIAFAPDGMLWVGMGDGGSGGDPNDRAEDTNALLGKMLRLDVSTPGTYTIPIDNPFAGGGGRGEIWALGLRNPWRFSFDRNGGNVYIADVGQGSYEEVNVASSQTPGINYGWDHREGANCHEPTSGCQTAGLTDPDTEYTHAGGRCSITGGYVYRGSCFPDIDGWYFFADYCTGEVWATQYDGATLSTPTIVLTGAGNVSSFGQDASGEVYLVSLGGTVSRIVVQ